MPDAPPNHLRRLLVLTVATLATLAGVDVGAALGESSRLYVAGRRAVIDQRWNEAVLYLSAAIEHQPRERGEVVVYGKHLEPYVPHFYLGVAFFELGALDAAVEAWSESDRQGYRSQIDGERYPTLGGFLDRYGQQQAMSRALGEVKGDLEALREQLDSREPVDDRPDLEAEWIAMRAAVDRATARYDALRADIGRAAYDAASSLELLDRTTRLSDAFDRLATATEAARWDHVVRRLDTRCDEATIDEWLALLDRAEPADASPEAIDAVAAGLARVLVEPCGRSQEVMLALARRATTRDGPAVRWARHLRTAIVDSPEAASAPEPTDPSPTCDRDAMARLSRWLERAAFEPTADDRDARRQLAAAHRACGEPALAALYDDRPAAERQPSTPSETPDTVSVESWSEVTLSLDAGACDPATIERLDGWIAARADGTSAGRLAGVPWDPTLYRAKAARNCADREGVARFLAESHAVDGSAPTDLGGLDSWYRQVAAADFYRGRYALVFGAGDYDDGRRGWADLPGARRDAEAVRDALLAYGFDDVRMVLDPKSRTLRREVEAFIERHGADAAEANLLLVYWAGHGAVLDGRYGGRNWSTGFLVPVDSPFPHATLDPGSDFARRAISMDHLDRWARSIRSRHAIFVLDSCYSGKALQPANTQPRTARRIRLRETTDMSEAWDPFARFRQPVRLMMTSSSADQQAADDSAFRRSLVDWLGQPAIADFRRDQVVSGQELCLHLAETTREASEGRQSPSCRCLPNPWDQGDVVFPVDRDGEDDEPIVARWLRQRFLADLATWTASREAGSPDAMAEYLRHFPEGRFASPARRALGAASR